MGERSDQPAPADLPELLRQVAAACQQAAQALARLEGGQGCLEPFPVVKGSGHPPATAAPERPTFLSRLRSLVRW